MPQFSWNPVTASIEPTWTTLNNITATAAANVYGSAANAVNFTATPQQAWNSGAQPVPPPPPPLPSASSTQSSTASTIALNQPQANWRKYIHTHIHTHIDS